MVNDVNRAVASRARRRAAQRSDGYSLLQIVITLAVVSILVSTALPTTMNALRNYRLTAAVSAATEQFRPLATRPSCTRTRTT